MTSKLITFKYEKLCGIQYYMPFNMCFQFILVWAVQEKARCVRPKGNFVATTYELNFYKNHRCPIGYSGYTA